MCDWRRPTVPIFVIALLVLCLAPVAPAQSGRGSLQGYVTSRVGNGGIPDVKIEIDSIETISGRKENRETNTDENGRYEMLQVTMGEYLLTISAPGYETYQSKIFIGSDMRVVLGTLLHRKKETSGTGV
jgi:Carboxypeptidase regulatory-like domain